MKRLITIFALLISTLIYGQRDTILSQKMEDRFWKVELTKNDVLVGGIQLFSGFMDGWHEAISSYHWGGGKEFWDAKTSWKRKYTNYDGGITSEKFFFSKSALIFLTDGYHLTRMFNRTGNIATIVIVRNDWKKGWKYMVKKAIVLSLVNRLGFVLSYDVIFK